MGKEKVESFVFLCERCNHRWIPRKQNDPKVCPNCKSPYWDTKRAKDVVV